MKGTRELFTLFALKPLSLSPLPFFSSPSVLLLVLLLHFVDIVSVALFVLDSSCCCFGTEECDVLAPWDTRMSLVPAHQLLSHRDLFTDIAFLPFFSLSFSVFFVRHTLLLPQRLFLTGREVEPCVCIVFLFSSVGCCL